MIWRLNRAGKKKGQILNLKIFILLLTLTSSDFSWALPLGSFLSTIE